MDPATFVDSLADESEAGAVRVLEHRDEKGNARWSALWRCEGTVFYRQLVAPGFWDAWEPYSRDAAAAKVRRDMDNAEVLT